MSLLSIRRTVRSGLNYLRKAAQVLRHLSFARWEW
jgi:hypothetical protein